MGVYEAVERDIEKLGGDLADGAEAATALALARELDASNSATSKSMCAKALNETMERLRAMAPPKKTNDRLDEVKRKREQRRGGRAAEA